MCITTEVLTKRLQSCPMPPKMQESMFLKSIACAPRQWYTKDSVFQLTQKMFRIMTLLPAFSATKRYFRWSGKENVDTSMRWVVIFTGFIPSCKMYKSQCRKYLNVDLKNVGDNASVISTKSHFKRDIFIVTNGSDYAFFMITYIQTTHMRF